MRLIWNVSVVQRKVDLFLLLFSALFYVYCSVVLFGYLFDVLFAFIVFLGIVVV